MASTAIRTPGVPARSDGATPVTASGRGFVARPLDLDRRAARVISAVRAGVVRPLLLVAGGGFLERRQADGQMRSSLALSSVGYPSLGHTHGARCSFRVVDREAGR